jgi:hypothetical protein
VTTGARDSEAIIRTAAFRLLHVYTRPIERDEIAAVAGTRTAEHETRDWADVVQRQG